MSNESSSNDFHPTHGMATGKRHLPGASQYHKGRNPPRKGGEKILMGMTIHLDTNLLLEVGLNGSAMRASVIAATDIISDAPLSTLKLKDFERFAPHGLRIHTF
jgi:hypothetical protein